MSGSLVRLLIKVLFPTPVIPMTPMKIGGFVPWVFHLGNLIIMVELDYKTEGGLGV